MLLKIVCYLNAMEISSLIKHFKILNSVSLYEVQPPVENFHTPFPKQIDTLYVDMDLAVVKNGYQ